MKFKTVDIKNFMSLGNISYNLDNPGLHLILGVNKDSEQFDSNGSGKSSLFDAVIWALYGEILRPVPIDSLVRQGEDSCSVSVTVDTDDSIITIVRSRYLNKKSTLKVLDSEGTDLFPSTSIVDMQGKINSTLGLDFKTFTNSVYFGKGLSQFFMVADDKTRKDILEAILQLVDFDTAYNKVKAAYKTLSDEIQTAEKALATVVELLASKHKDYDEYFKNYDELKINNVIQIEQFTKEKTLISNKILSFDSNLKEIREKIEKHNARYTKIKTGIEAEMEMEKEIVTNNCRAREERAEIAYKNDIASLTKTYEALVTVINDEQKGVIATIKELEEEKSSLAEENYSFKTKIKDLTDQLFSINSLAPDSTCLTCKSLITEKHKHDVCAKIKTELAEASVIHLDISNKIKINTEKLSNCNNENSRLSSLKQDAQLKFNNDKLSRLSTKQDILRKIEEGKNIDFLAIRDRYSNRLNQEFMSYTDAVNSSKEEVARLTAEKDQLLSRSLLLNTTIKSLEDQIEQTASFLTKLDTELTSLEKKKKEHTKKIKTGAKELEALSFWMTAFSQKGIRSFIFESSLPELSSRANYYSAALTGGSITINILPTTTVKSTGGSKEKLNIVINNSLGAASYDGCSEGEKRRIDLCLLLALQDLVSSRGTKTWDTSFFDEVFDTLDNTGISAVIDLLKTEAPNKSIYLISHNNDLKNFFDSAIVVTKENGVSTICQ